MHSIYPFLCTLDTLQYLKDLEPYRSCPMMLSPLPKHLSIRRNATSRFTCSCTHLLVLGSLFSNYNRGEQPVSICLIACGPWPKFKSFWPWLVQNSDNNVLSFLCVGEKMGRSYGRKRDWKGITLTLLILLAGSPWQMKSPVECEFWQKNNSSVLHSKLRQYNWLWSGAAEGRVTLFIMVL